jgi:thiamine biosynthesis lipoprotein
MAYAISRFTKLCLICCLLWTQSSVAGWHTDEQAKMGTRVEVQLWSDDPVVAAKLLGAAMAEFDRIEALMSTYIDASEMSRVNDHAFDAPQEVSLELFSLLQESVRMSTLTDGAFDITFDSVGVLYDFREGKKPSTQDIAEQLGKIDYKLVELDPVNHTVSFLASGVRINLGGIAKGYAVERVIALLSAAGIEHALATAGGDTRLLGDRRDKPWIVGIRDPNDKAAVYTRLALNNEAISTSGDYERYFIEDGKRYHHILRPADGKPVEGVRSVTVIGPNATMTDGLSTSIFVMGPEAGLAMLAKLPGYDAVVITDDQLYYSEGLNPG